MNLVLKYWIVLATIVALSLLNYEVIAQSCSTPISNYPHNIDFESGLNGWTQATNGSEDDIDWTVRSGATPSSGTGPSEAYQENNYIYIEASGSNYPEKEAIIISPCFDIHSTALPSVEFAYHMLGNWMGELNLEVSVGNSNIWTNIWNRTGNQSADWINESVDLSAYKGDNIRLRFRGITGPPSGGWQSDIALDHITVYGGPSSSTDSCDGRVQDGLVAYYNFKEGQGNVVYDVSGVGIPMHLSTEATSGYEWVSGGGLRSTSSVFFSYDRQAKKLYDAVTSSNAFSVEAWVLPDNITQEGPARMVTYSDNVVNRNFTLGQEYEGYHCRVRTSDTSISNNGTPALESDDIIRPNERQHIVYTFNGVTNTEHFYVNGVLVSTDTRLGLLTNWNANYIFGILNEATGDRDWRGLLYSMAVYDKELSYIDVQTNILQGGTCDSFLQPSPISCGDFADVDIICTGLKNDVPSTITIPNTDGLDSVKVEVIYKGNIPGITISVEDDQGTSYYASGVDMASNARLYSFDLPPTSTVTYSNTTNADDAQSMCVYTFTSGQQGKRYVTRYTEIAALPNSTEWLFFDLPYREASQDISIILPISEVTYDNRSLTITARSGDVSKTVSRTWGSSGAGFPDGCCVDTLHITLPDVPPSTTHFSLEIESPSSAGQSYVLAGLVAIEIDCGEDEICEDGIDNDFDGLTDCDDPDCDGVLAFTVDVGPDLTQCYNAGFSLNADIVGCPDYGMWTVESGNAILNENIWWHEIGAVVAPGQSAVLRYTAFKGATTVYDELTISNTTNCSDECIEPLNQNGDIEDEGTATNFNLMLESTPALLIEENINPTSWEERYGGTATDVTQFNGAFYFKKTGTQSDPYSGTHAIYLKGEGKCLSAMTVSSDLACGSSYRFSVQIAAYSYNATQGDAEFALEFSAGGDAETLYPVARLTAPASTSWNDLNWNRYYFDVEIPDNGYYWGDFYFTSKDNTHGIVVDDVCITQLSQGATAIAGADQSGCDNVFQLSANSASPGFTGGWTVTSGNVSVSPTDSESATATINSGNVASLEWTLTDGDGCSDTDEVILSYTPLSDITVNSEDICAGQSVTLTATGCTESILWSTGDTTQSITVSPSNSTDYTATCYFKPSDNLLHNPGFENAGALTHWQNWGSSSVVTNAADVYSGSKAMMADATTVSWAGFGQNLLATPGEYFEVTAFAKATNVSKFPYLSLAFLDDSWETIGEQNLQVVNSIDYQEYTITGLAPPGTVRVQVSAGVSGPNAQIFVDDVVLVRSEQCSKSAVATVTVTPQPVAAFTVDSICAHSSLVIEAAEQVTGTTYNWTLESGTPTSATGQSVTAVWSTTGIYDVELTVSNGDCSDSSLQQVTVQSADGGIITGDEISCTSYQGSTLRSYADPVVSGGNYTLQWQQSTDGVVWNDIVGATALEYTSGIISTTTYYRRAVLHSLCQNIYSNTIIKRVDSTLPICPEDEEFAFPCQTGYSISPTGKGINGDVDPFLRVLNATFFDYYIVEATFSGGVGAPESVIFTNEDGEERVVNLQYYEGESGTAGARYFKTILPASDTVFVDYIGDENLAESLTAYPVGQGFSTSDRESFGQSVHQVLSPGDVHKVSFPLAATTDEKDIYTSFNFSAVVDNGTELYVRIYADGGSLTDTLTTPSHGSSLGLSFINIEDVAPDADSLHIEITSPTANGQTAYLSGYITAIALCDNNLVIRADSDADCVAVGDTITYDYTLYNFANVEFTNVNATSSLGGDIDFGASVIPADTTFTATHAIVITQEMIDNPPIVNDVFVFGWNFSAFGIKPKSDDFKDTLTICEICDDGIDNDNDGMTDCLDPDCYEGVANAAQISVSTAEGCEGDTVQLTVLEAGYQYQWSANANAATTQSISVILPRVASSGSPFLSYGVTVTSASGCTAEATATVQVHNAPVVTPSTDTICSGESIYIVPSATSSNISELIYRWDTGQTADSILVSPTTTTDYVVTVTDSEGCTATTTYVVVVKDTPQVTLQSTDYNGCLGDTVTISVSEAYPSYQWGASAGNATSQSVDVYLDPNGNQPFINYAVTVTNDEGCSTTESINIFIYAPPVVAVSANDTICAGSVATLFAGGADSYLWSTGSSGSSISVVPAVTTDYEVVGTSIYGCKDTATVRVVVGTTLESQLQYLGADCLTDSTKLQVIPSGGTSPYTYQWLGPNGLAGTTQIIPVDTNGHYYVTVTDDLGCESYNSGFIYQRYEPTILNLQTHICEGESVSLSVNSSNAAAFQWSTNAGSSTGPSVVVYPIAPSSSYQVTVTNNEGCTAVAEATIGVKARPTIDLNGAENLCIGELVQLSPQIGGTWSSNNAAIAIVNSSAQLIANGPGSTAVQFTETASGCASSPALVSVTINPTLATSDDVGICSGSETTLLATSSGIAPLSYSWSNGLSTADTLHVTATAINNIRTAADYFVTVTDGNGCTAEKDVEVTAYSLPVATVAVQHTLCDQSNGSITFSFDDYLYRSTIRFSINGGANWTEVSDLLGSYTFSNLQAGDYELLSSWSDGGCQYDLGVATLLPYYDPVAQVSVDNGACGTTSEGSIIFTFPDNALRSHIEFSIDGGASYPYRTEDDAGSLSVSNVSVGSYDTWVRWGNGQCPIPLGTYDILSAQSPTASISGGTASCASSTILLDAIGGSTYLWSTGETTPSIQVTPMSTTTYTVTVTSAGGCEDVASHSVAVSPALNLALDFHGSECLTDSSRISAIPSGGVAPYTYAWAIPNNTTATSQEIDTEVNGTYAVTVTDANGCSANSSGFIYQQFEAFIINLQTDICEGEAVNLTANSSSAASYQWSASAFSAITPTVTVYPEAPSSLYTVTITNSNGCTAVATANVTATEVPDIEIDGPSSLCVGETTTVTSNTSGIWISSNPSVASVSFGGIVSALSAGTTYLSFMDATSGCTSAETLLLNVHSSPSPVFQGASIVCVGEHTQLSPSTGGSWVSQNSAVASVNSNGLVSALNNGITKFTWTNTATGCSATTSQSLLVNGIPSITVPVATPLCIGGTAQAFPSSGGQWTSENPSIATITNTGHITGLAQGKAAFTFTNTSTGCAVTSTDSITILPQTTVSFDGPTAVCIGEPSAVLPSSGGTWTSDNPMVATISNAGIITSISTGTARFRFTNTATGCTSDFTDILIVNPKPMVSNQGNSTLCEGNTTQLSPATGGVWTSSNTSIATVDSGGLVTAVSSGTVSFTFTDSSTGCVASLASPINVVNPPEIELNGPDQLCVNSTVTLSPSSGGVWTSSNNSIATVSSIGVVTSVAAGTVTFTFTENSTGCQSVQSLQVTVLDRPFAAITGASSLCVGSTTNLSPSVGGVWVSTAPSVAAVTNAGVVTAVGPGLARFSFVSDAGCSSNQTTPLIVYADPVAILVGDNSACIGGTGQLLPSSGGTWTSSNTSIATVTDGGLITGLAAGLVTFTYTDTTTGCMSESSEVLTIDDGPAVNISGPTNICIGQMTNVAPTVGGVWVSSDPSVATIDNAGNVTGLSSGTATFTFIEVGSGCSSSPTEPITVAAGTAVLITGSTQLCIGGTSTLSPMTGGTWTSTNTAVATVTNSGIITAISQGVARFRFTNSITGCQSELSAPITISDGPTTGFTGADDICIGSTTTVSPSTGGVWTSSDTSIATVTSSGVVTAVGSGVATLSFVDSSTGCDGQGTLLLTVVEQTAVDVTGALDICLGGHTLLSPSSGGTWTSSNPAIATVTNSGVVTGIAPGTVTFSFTDIAGGCTLGSQTEPVTVSSCTTHDFNVTSPGLSISSSVMTNDNVPAGTTYGSSIITVGKPAGSLPQLTMQADGTYTFVAAMPGKYIYSIPVCIPPAALGCSRTKLEITVLGNLFSEYNVVSNLEQGATYASTVSTVLGTPVTIASAANDQCVNAPGCTLDNASYTIVEGPNHGAATIDGMGNITYTPGVGYIGRDTIEYQVCADGDPMSCDIGHQIITIGHTSATNGVYASDDFAWGMKDLPVTGTVLANDGDAEGDLLTITAMGSVANPVAIAGGEYTIAADGSYTFWPADNFTGYAEVIYTVCDDNAVQACTDATLHLLVFDDLTVALKVYLEGALMTNRNETAADGSPLMRDDLRVNPFDGKNYIPTDDPYTFPVGILDFTANYPKVGPALLSENQVIADSAAVFGVTGQDAIVDWVFVEIRDKSNVTNILGSRAGLVQRDGDVVDLDGVSDLRFKGVNADSFYVVVNHKSHLGAMSLLVSNGEVVDFRSLDQPLFDFGVHPVTGLDYTGLATNNNVKAGYRTLWAGDFDGNGVVKYENPFDDHNMLFFTVVTLLGNELGTSNYDFGYTYAESDYNMNGKVKYDNPNDDKNMLFYQVIAYPLNEQAMSNFSSIIEQVPR